MLHYNRIYLRYYATLKVRKSESLFYKFNTCLQKKKKKCYLHWVVGRVNKMT